MPIRVLPLCLWSLATVLAVPAAAGAERIARQACRLTAGTAAAAGPGCAERWMDANLRLNDLSVVGTHNSYKRAIPRSDYAVAAKADARGVMARDYAHKPLDQQLDAGVREIEIDVVYDPRGGRYAHPQIAGQAHDRLDPLWTRAMIRPGFKVMHVPDLDFRSTCVTLKACLTIVRRWSDAHPRHVPILILINAKDGVAVPGGVPLLTFDQRAFDAFDREVRSVLPASKLVTPDDVQGSYPTLRDAVLHGNWPKLGDARGHILFALDEDQPKVAAYRGRRHSLEGRVMFVNIDENSPAAAYRTLNDPIGNAAQIARDVRAGFLVRTRADVDTWQARANDAAHRDAALRSGAQAVSTDYIWPDHRFPGGFSVRLPNRQAALCNPLRTDARCAGLPVERVTDKDWRLGEQNPVVVPDRQAIDR
ncbi:MAG TPA: phosphatidylinositol-specific phospholipase C1-like protein [Sphingomonas sp.]|uniref:phosphatidylinositol-specific phospholipase C1-like protein n=1 Tax=Sphingomonas sp. TaxID=28214 RepID=UPI002B7C7B8C|nr:phosphatidylinositol-specific phospholipase C1-like protein [Sphingomonas sp.]HMI19837.1 phosphatidylinositol-specific phospholipase C1-like protein [Sphingomonas sp.]